MFQNPFSFQGRIRRTEYVLSIGIFTAIFGGIAFFSAERESSPAMFILWIPCVWFMFAQRVKRSHDLNNTGWYLFIPFYGFLLLFGEGTEGPNEYGSDPKDRDYPEPEELDPI